MSKIKIVLDPFRKENVIQFPKPDPIVKFIIEPDKNNYKMTVQFKEGATSEALFTKEQLVEFFGRI
jgi:hypothetical protein